jgi:hypothetical protein
VVVLAVVAAVIVSLLRPGPPPSFEASKFRAARAKGDTSVMQTQARLAVDQRALVGLSETRLRAVLGDPTRRYRRSSRLVWQVGGLDASGSPGTKLEVHLDGSTQHAVDARLDPRYD